MPYYGNALGNAQIPGVTAPGGQPTNSLSGQAAQNWFTQARGQNPPPTAYDWAWSYGHRGSELDLFDPTTLATLQDLFKPLFEGRRTQAFDILNQGMNKASGEAGRSAGAYASFLGQDPRRAVTQAKSRAREPFANMYGQVGTQLGVQDIQDLLNAVSGSQKFKAGNLFNAANVNLGLSGQDLQRYMFDQQLENQPSFWENLLSGLISGGANLLSGMAAGGTGWFRAPKQT